ncbi:UNVERIFIED_CONTAM: hypothetical protein GTU68_021576 [Idotea baltica]|nr:hypothetical protein [Idotea baltica]
MKQAQAMQTKMAELQKEAENKIVEGKSGGGMVVVTSTCNGKIKGIKIDPSIVDPADTEMLEDLIVAAINNAKETADSTMNEEMQKLAGSMGLPPSMMKMPF